MTRTRLWSIASFEFSFCHSLSHLLTQPRVPDKLDSQWLPRDSSGIAVSARMVDYGIVLQDDPPKRRPHRDKTLQQRLASHPELTSPSINHTSRHDIRTMPIAISIETKTISRTDEEARVQLAIWISAQIQRIRWILDQRDAHTDLLSRMVFPLLFVQSSRWTIMFARLDPISMTRLVSSNRLPCSPRVAELNYEGHLHWGSTWRYFDVEGDVQSAERLEAVKEVY